jgi:hypothetical protein
MIDEGLYPAQREHERAAGALKARRRTDLICCEHDVPHLADPQVSRSPRAVFPQEHVVYGARELVPDVMARAGAVGLGRTASGWRIRTGRNAAAVRGAGS